jgi:hypothetical protein
LTRLERALADVVVGHDGGWSFWLAALAELEAFVHASRADGRPRFDSYPEGELRRLKLEIESVLERAALAVELRAVAWGAEGDARTVDEHRDSIAELLLERAHQRVDKATPLLSARPPT